MEGFYFFLHCFEIIIAPVEIFIVRMMQQAIFTFIFSVLTVSDVMAIITVIIMHHVRIVLVHLIVLVTLDMMGMALPVLVCHLLNVMFTIL